MIMIISPCRRLITKSININKYYFCQQPPAKQSLTDMSSFLREAEIS